MGWITACFQVFDGAKNQVSDDLVANWVFPGESKDASRNLVGAGSGADWWLVDLCFDDLIGGTPLSLPRLDLLQSVKCMSGDLCSQSRGRCIH